MEAALLAGGVGDKSAFVRCKLDFPFRQRPPPPPPYTHTRTCKGFIFQQIYCSLKTPQLFLCQPFCIPQPCCMKIRGRCAYARGPGALSAIAEAPRSPPAPREISPAERRALLSSKRRNNRPVMTEV